MTFGPGLRKDVDDGDSDSEESDHVDSLDEIGSHDAMSPVEIDTSPEKSKKSGQTPLDTLNPGEISPEKTVSQI